MVIVVIVTFVIVRGKKCGELSRRRCPETYEKEICMSWVFIAELMKMLNVETGRVQNAAEPLFLLSRDYQIC